MTNYKVKCPYCSHIFTEKTAKTRGNIKVQCFSCMKKFYVYPIHRDGEIKEFMGVML